MKTYIIEWNFVDKCGVNVILNRTKVKASNEIDALKEFIYFLRASLPLRLRIKRVIRKDYKECALYDLDSNSKRNLEDICSRCYNECLNYISIEN